MAFCSFGQNSKKETISRYKLLTGLSLDTLKTQNYSKLAKELSIENFLSYYIEKGKERVTKEHGHEYIDSLYTDTIYSYYIHRTTNYPIDFIKVKAIDLQHINMSNIDGNFIRQKFIEEIVPASDKERVKRKSKSCSMGSTYSDFKYNYDRKTKLVEVKYKWKITCDFLRVINKNYSSFYSLDKKAFQN